MIADIDNLYILFILIEIDVYDTLKLDDEINSIV
jgi:hypothetical protein